MSKSKKAFFKIELYASEALEIAECLAAYANRTRLKEDKAQAVGLVILIQTRLNTVLTRAESASKRGRS